MRRFDQRIRPQAINQAWAGEGEALDQRGLPGRSLLPQQVSLHQWRFSPTCHKGRELVILLQCVSVSHCSFTIVGHTLTVVSLWRISVPNLTKNPILQRLSSRVSAAGGLFCPVCASSTERGSSWILGVGAVALVPLAVGAVLLFLFSRGHK